MLMSATTSEDVDRLTKLVLHNPLALNLLSASGIGAAGAEGAAGALAGCEPEQEKSVYCGGINLRVTVQVQRG